MTSGIPPVRPGAVQQPDTSTNDRVRRLEELVAELQRKDMNRATVGQGGTFRGYYDNGQLAFTFGEDLDDGVRKVRMNYASNGGVAFQVGPGNPAVGEDEQFKLVDQAGRKVFATDGLAGYGLAEPALSIPLYTIYGLSWVSGVEQVIARATPFLYNPVVVSSIQARAFAGGVTAVSGRLRVTDGNGATVVSSSTAIGANGTVTRMVLLPESFINAQNCSVEWLFTTTGSGTLDGWPRDCHGASKSLYDGNPGAH
jgi:hypothetical protein